MIDVSYPQVVQKKVAYLCVGAGEGKGGRNRNRNQMEQDIKS